MGIVDGIFTRDCDCGIPEDALWAHADIPCPSGADPARNPHRSGQGWMLTTVAAILANPRYTGRQVWNRQRTDHDDLTPDGTAARHREVQRWNVAPQWVISRQIAHPPLVTEEQFVAAQAIHTAPTPTDGAPRHYLLAGLVCCGVCGRIMDSTGSTADLATAAATATPAVTPKHPTARRLSTSGKTASSTASATNADFTATAPRCAALTRRRSPPTCGRTT
ncbi:MULTISPECIES: recombinase family protein [unclassified Micromonospora]|uniref:recombinase family protein n=1 Tax=unclassified Micromonospora TaxID=2617518 RepID=UPI0018E9EC37|nr:MULTISPECIES: recombinase family protein [unclassified Micromonospora]